MDFDREELFEASPQDELIDLISGELSAIRERIGEIRSQIESMQSSVEREQTRYSNIATELRSIKENLDTVPREDIRDKYDEALEVRFRLATMRGQLEKFESTYDNLEAEQQLLSQILSQVQGYDMLEQDGSEGGGSDGGLDIISIINAQEDERKRLARAMHDGPAQSLTNFILKAEICQRLFDRDMERAAEELGELKGDASKTFQKVREFIFDLRPMMLEDLGIAPTVRRYAESYRDKSEIDVHLDILGDERRFNDHIEVMIFRSIQDVMSAARDYASPTEIEMVLDLSDTMVKITIEDNGKAFDAEDIFEKVREEGYSDARAESLYLVKGKLELVGGTIDVTSEEGEGTVVRMEVPNEF